MIYTIEKAELIAEQMRRFTFGYAHHVAGQFSNIDFWLEEVQAAMKTIDEYHRRFTNIKDSQKTWVENHGTVVHEYCPYCDGKCELSDGSPSPPVRMAHSELKLIRKKLKDNTYYFLIRCHSIGLVNLYDLKAMCASIGASVEPSDLEKKSKK